MNYLVRGASGRINNIKIKLAVFQPIGYLLILKWIE